MNNLLLKSKFEIFETKALQSEHTMRFDERLLEGLENSPKHIIHFYDWVKPSATYGLFLKPEDFLDLGKADKRGLALGKRPTGGGIVFHLWDLAFSVLVPASSPYFSLNTLENYAFVNNAVLKAVRSFLGDELSLTPDDLPASDASCQNFCMARPTKYDVMLGARKVAGAAQRKTRHGFLHQGTIALCMPDMEFLNDVLIPGTEVAQSMVRHTQPLLKGNVGAAELKDAKQTLKQLLSMAFNEGSE